MELNPKQKRFCEEYVIDLNATQAYIRAGYEANAAKECASRLLTNANVQEYIAFLQAEVEQRTKVTLDSVVFMINEIAEDGEENRDRLKALDMLMKHLGGYTADKEVKEEVIRWQ